MDANLIDSFVSIRVHSWLFFVAFGWGNAALRSFTANWYSPTSFNGSSLDGVLSSSCSAKEGPGSSHGLDPASRLALFYGLG